MRVRTYSELISNRSFEERFEYLKLGGEVGRSTFGFDRYLNQRFYKSREWQDIRNHVISRDEGCDLGWWDRPILSKILIHHMNPITEEQILDRDETILDPEYLISVSLNTHNAIHYGDSNLLYKLPKERRRGDTKLW